MKRKYEMMFILDSIRFEEIKIKKEIQDVITQYDGLIIKEQDLGLRNLAYPIKKQKKGFYYLIHAELDSLRLKEFNHEILLNEHILKSMMIFLNRKILKRIEQKEKREKEKKEKEKREKSVAYESDSSEALKNNHQSNDHKTQDKKDSKVSADEPKVSEKVVEETS